ncbi:MAG: M1 family aminopeptidase, partial [Candidatus Eisenbacteria bacterium]|nr:M1 family aminopeptidase [Candidatus Eisenbacteria bacterium]
RFFKDFSRFPEEMWGEEKIEKFIFDGAELPVEVDDTIGRVALPRAILPGETVLFEITFKGRIPEHLIRMGRRGRDFNIAQWYPKICVYDLRGWHKDQYIGQGEFYGDFGTFDVSLTLPGTFLVAHTGTLTNPGEVLPDSVIKKLATVGDTTLNIADNSNWLRPSDPTLRKELEKPKTWRFRADNVHDFAFAANEKYIWDATKLGNVYVHTFYFKNKAVHWREMAGVSRECVRFYSETFGGYPYDQVSVVATSVHGGMEYPNLAFIGSEIGDERSRFLSAVIAHEIAHNWFYGIIGSNENDEAWLDEGFTSFATILFMENYYGRNNDVRKYKRPWERYFFPPEDKRESSQFDYISFAETGYEEQVITPSDKFGERIAYRTAVYQKSAAILFMLQYVLGDETFDRVMKEYFALWQFKHPYTEDFIAVAERMSGRKLGWFFDEWLRRTYRCDYAVKGMKFRRLADGRDYSVDVRIEKKGRAIMPLDFAFRSSSGETRVLSLPHTVWDDGRRSYTLKGELPFKPVGVEMNPDKRIADVDRRNNVYPYPKLKFQFDNPVHASIPIDAYRVTWRPAAWFNDIDGVKVGPRLGLSFLEDQNLTALSIWYGTRNAGWQYDCSYSTPLGLAGYDARVGVRSYTIDGREGYSFFFRRRLSSYMNIGPYHTVTLSINEKRLLRESYLRNPLEWEKGAVRTLDAGYSLEGSYRRFNLSGGMHLETSVPGSAYSYDRLTGEATVSSSPMGLFHLEGRTYLGATDGRPPVQRKLYLSGADPYQEFENGFFRSKGLIRPNWHGRLGGAGNLRGYFDRDPALFTGARIASANVEISFDNLVPILPDGIFGNSSMPFSLLRSALFVDVGKVWEKGEAFSTSGLLWDGGFGIRTKKLVGGLRLRFDFPVFLSDPAPWDDRWKWRWLFSVEGI